MSIQEMKRLDDYKKYKISLPLVNLASCHYLNGDYVQAERLLLEGLASRVEEFGKDDRESFITGRFYHGLACVKRGLGSDKEAFEFLLKARDHYQKTLGRGHHRSADVAVALGRHYGRSGQYETAYTSLGARPPLNMTLMEHMDTLDLLPMSPGAVMSEVEGLKFLASEEFCNSALAICETLRPFLKQSAALSRLVDVAQIDRTIAEIHHNHRCINAEMNRPQDALRHQLIFNTMMQKELAGKKGSDMRLAMSF
ncbi:Glutamine synthetase [Venturia nashicola]|uniref:Glutamine synthetase n=1 Tax=Venturia nashicola TaxID=86259 RepID=A0A4Z1NTF7_9PEZI|nr:Glutamine synthetase [Venturia nashicola]